MQNDSDVIEVTDVSGCMLNAESHLGCRSFHDLTSFINVISLFLVFTEKHQKVFFIKTSIIGSIYEKMLKNNIIEMSVSNSLVC